MRREAHARSLFALVCAVMLFACQPRSLAQNTSRSAEVSASSVTADVARTVDAREINLSGRPIRGAKDAKVTIVFFDDFQCPYSGQMYKTLFDDVMKDYVGRVKVALRDTPNPEIHPWAKHAAINANCLAAQNNDAYWRFADYVHAHQQEMTADRLDELALTQAETNNLQISAVQECIRVQSDNSLKQSRSESIHGFGVKDVPTLFINNENLRGARSAQQVREAIDRALRALSESTLRQTAPAPGRVEAVQVRSQQVQQ